MRFSEASEVASFGSTDSRAISAMLTAAQLRGVYPGAVWVVGDADGVVARGEVGVLDPDEPEAPMGPDTMFDVASLTKITAVWSLIGCLWDQGLLSLGDRVDRYLWETSGHPLGSVTLEQLLTHTAGLPLRSQLEALYGTDAEAVRLGVLREELNREPGTAVDYTDRASLILGYLAEELIGKPLDQAAEELIWRPLGMDDTRFGPVPADLVSRCAPTEADSVTGVRPRGTVHDFSARLLGGVCGVAGVFSTADDLGRFAQYMVATAAEDAVKGFSKRWVDRSLQLRTGSLKPPRGLFWHPALNTGPEDDIWTHYGFTGTALWVSRARERWAVLLTNKVYFSREREPLNAVRNAFCALALSVR